MEKRDADGVDFVPVFTTPETILYTKIIKTYTKSTGDAAGYNTIVDDILRILEED